MKKIVVPVDFSIYSENALMTAANLAKKNNSEVIVVHRLELPSALLSQSENALNQQAVFYLKLTEKKFESFLDKDFLEGVNVVSSVRNYHSFAEIADMALKENADLIVMGSKGVSGLKEVFVGSNTEKVVRSSEVPVLVVKEPPVLSCFSKALYACDFSLESVNAYLKAKLFLKMLGVEMQLVYVNTPGFGFKSSSEQRDIVLSFLGKVGEDVSVLEGVDFISDYSVERGVLGYASMNKIDLIVMATHGRSGISHFFEGSVSEDVANHSDIPVVTFKM